VVRCACEDWLRITLEPRGKVDAMTMRDATKVADGGVAVDGPEDEPLDWDAVDWRQVEEDLRRLRQRIFAAARAGTLALLPVREPSGLARAGCLESTRGRF